MRLTRVAAAAGLLATTFACQAGERTLASPHSSQAPRAARVGHTKQISPFRGLPGLSLSLAAPAGGIAVQDMTDGITALAMAQALVGPGVTISNVSYTGATGAAGIFAADSAVLGMTSGVVLSTGAAKAVIGPNQFEDVTTDWSGAGDTQLSALVGNNETFDASILEFDFVPDSSTIYIAAYVFGSDEYNEFVNSDFNDAMAFYVNGTNCALVGGLPVSINAINNGYPYNTDPRSNPDLYRNNSLSDGGATINTELDGLTHTLTCAAAVNKGVANHVKLAIADVFDGLFDSDVFIGGGSITTVPPAPIPLPHARASWSMVPDCVRGGALVTLDASQSFETGGGGIASYDWYYGNVQSGQIYATGKVATRHFDALGVWPMALVVTDSAGHTAQQVFSFTVNANPVPVDAFAVSPLTLSPADGQYRKMAVTATSVGACPDPLAVVAASSQGDQVNPTGDQAGDIRVVHHDGSVVVSSNAAPALTFDPAVDTLYLRAETLDSVTNRTYKLVMTANGAPRDSATVVVPHPLPAGHARWAIFANGDVGMNGNTRTDSYNSTLGGYSASAHDSLGSVAAIGPIRFDGKKPRVEGDATSGGTIPGGAYVTGTRTEQASLQAMSVVACPAGAYTAASAIGGSKFKYTEKQGDLSVSGKGSIVLNGAGPLYFSSVSVSGQATLTVSGSQHVDVYISDDFSASGNGIANAALDPGAISFIACGSPHKPSDWEISGNAESYFTLYAPNHDVKISGNGALFGCLVADAITLDGNAQVHLDESLGRPCASGTTGGGGVTDVGPGTGRGGGSDCKDDDRGKKGSDQSCHGDKGDDNNGHGHGNG